MNTPAPTMMPVAVQTAIGGHVEALLEDPRMSVEIEYRRAGKTTYSATTGTQTRANKGRWTFRAIQEKLDEKAAKQRNADDIFLFPKGSMPMDPRRGDEIRVGKNVWTIVKWDADLQGIIWQVEARRSNA